MWQHGGRCGDSAALDEYFGGADSREVFNRDKYGVDSRNQLRRAVGPLDMYSRNVNPYPRLSKLNFSDSFSGRKDHDDAVSRFKNSHDTYRSSMGEHHRVRPEEEITVRTFEYGHARLGPTGGFKNQMKEMTPNTSAPSKDEEKEDVPLPEELLKMFGHHKCDLCICTHPSMRQADVHYTGKQHMKRVKRYLQLWSEREGKEVPASWLKMACNKKPVSSLPNDGSAEKCKVCNISFLSPYLALQHYEGKEHEIAVEIYLKKYPGASVVTKKSLEASTVKLECDICNIKVTSLAHLENHLHGTKHKKMARKLEKAAAEEMEMECLFSDLTEEDVGGDGVKWESQTELGSTSPGNSAVHQSKDSNAKYDHITDLFCKLCNVKLASEKEIEPHVDSKDHLNAVGFYKKQNVLPVEESVAVDIKCDVCKMKFPSQSVYDSHLNWKSHIEKIVVQLQSVRKHKTCELCRMDFFSDRSYEVHFASQLHIGNEKWVKEWQERQGKSILSAESGKDQSVKETKGEVDVTIVQSVTQAVSNKGKSSKKDADTCHENRTDCKEIYSPGSGKNEKKKVHSEIKLGLETSSLSLDKVVIPREESVTKKNAGKVFECKICRISLLGINSYENHLRSTKHTLKLSLQSTDTSVVANEPSGLSEDSSETVSSQQLHSEIKVGLETSSKSSDKVVIPREESVTKKKAGNVFECKICSISLLGINSYENHLRSTKHTLNLSLQSTDTSVVANEPGSLSEDSSETVSSQQVHSEINLDFETSSQSLDKVVIPREESVTKKNAGKVFECKICRISVIGINSYENHLRSTKHTLKLSLQSTDTSVVANEPGGLSEDSSETVSSQQKPISVITNLNWEKLISDGTNNNQHKYDAPFGKWELVSKTFYCELCNVYSKTYNQYNSHLKSSKHKKFFREKQTPKENFRDSKSCQNVRKEFPTVNLQEYGEPEKLFTSVYGDVSRTNEKMSTKRTRAEKDQFKFEKTSQFVATTQDDEGEDTTVLECKVCGISVVGVYSYELHIGSLKHILKLADSQTTSGGQKLATVANNKGTMETLYCEVCNYSSKTSIQHESHLKSNKHKSAVIVQKTAHSKSKLNPTLQNTAEKVNKTTTEVISKEIHKKRKLPARPENRGIGLHNIEAGIVKGPAVTDNRPAFSISFRNTKTMCDAAQNVVPPVGNNIPENVQNTNVSSSFAKKQPTESFQSSEITGDIGRNLSEISDNMWKKTFVEIPHDSDISCGMKISSSDMSQNASNSVSVRRNNYEQPQNLEVSRGKMNFPVTRSTGMYCVEKKALQESPPRNLNETLQSTKAAEGRNFFPNYYPAEASHATGNTQTTILETPFSTDMFDAIKQVLQRLQTTKMPSPVEKKLPERPPTSNTTHVSEKLLSKTILDTTVPDSIKKALERFKNSDILHLNERLSPERSQKPKISHLISPVSGRCSNTERSHVVEKSFPQRHNPVISCGDVESPEIFNAEISRAAKKSLPESHMSAKMLETVVEMSRPAKNEIPQRHYKGDVSHLCENEPSERRRKAEISRSYENKASENHRTVEVSHAVEKKIPERYRTIQMSHDVAKAIPLEHQDTKMSDPLKEILMKSLQNTAMSDKMRSSLIEKLKTTEITQLMQNSLPEWSWNTEMFCVKGISPERYEDTKMAFFKERSPPEKYKNIELPHGKEKSSSDTEMRHGIWSQRSENSDKFSGVESTAHERSWNTGIYHVERSEEEMEHSPEASVGKRFTCKVCRVTCSSSSEFDEHTDAQKHLANIELLRRFISRFKHLSEAAEMLDYEDEQLTSGYTERRKCFKCGTKHFSLRDFNRHILDTHWPMVLLMRKRKYDQASLDSNCEEPSTSYSSTESRRESRVATVPTKHPRLQYYCALCRKRYSLEEDYLNHCCESDIHKKRNLPHRKSDLVNESTSYYNLSESVDTSIYGKSDLVSVATSGHNMSESAISISEYNSSNRVHGLRDSEQDTATSCPSLSNESQKEQSVNFNRKHGKVVSSWNRK